MFYKSRSLLYYFRYTPHIVCAFVHIPCISDSFNEYAFVKRYTSNKQRIHVRKHNKCTKIKTNRSILPFTPKIRLDASWHMCVCVCAVLLGCCLSFPSAASFLFISFYWLLCFSSSSVYECVHMNDACRCSMRPKLFKGQWTLPLIWL